MSRSAQPTFLSGQPRLSASGSGIAATTGLRATEPPSVGVKPDASVLSRTSQVEESGSHTSGASSVPLALPTPARPTLCCPAITAAMSTELTSLTSAATHVPSAEPPSARQLSKVERTAGAISGAAATESLTSPVQREPASSR
ncbi:hypothetical protein Pflav_082870 [Phytohabitans flavus]|uniref:Uncharacterized protein n=1 Tax=Phytohabitans flavus TaxID=1076124 RepID=A0A6F8Y738_9ACTN|nr:hypothetical protein Pflav_082870 [Phytohabitans flavus]